MAKNPNKSPSKISTGEFTKEQLENMSPEFRKIIEEVAAEEKKLAEEKKAATVQRRNELKAQRNAEKKARAAELKATQTAARTAAQAESTLAKLKDKVAASEQAKAPPTQTTPSRPVSTSGGGFFSDALESTAESDYNTKDTRQGRKALGSIARFLGRNLISRPIKGIAAAAGGILSTQYMGLSAPTALAALGYEKLTGGISSMFSGSSKSSKDQNTTNALSSFTGKNTPSNDLSILKRILSETQKTNDTLEDVVDALDRQVTQTTEDRREVKQQNAEIIRLLEVIAAGGGKSEGNDKKGFWDKLKEGILGGFGSLLKIASGLFSDLFGSVFRLFEGIGGKILGLLGGLGLGLGGKLLRSGITAARFVGRGITKAAGFVAGGIKNLFSKGGAEAAETVAESGIKAAEKTGAEAAEKGTGKAAEKILAKEGSEVAAKEGAKTAGKSGIKAIVAKVIGPKVAKVVAKSVPFVGALAGLGFGIARAMEGDWKGAGAEVAGGAASIFPGVGTAASVATDVGLLARDVYKSAYGVFPEDDPLSGERLEEVKKEVMDYIGSNVSGSKSQDASKVNPSAPTASENAGNVTSTLDNSSDVVPTSAVSPTLNPAVGFNRGSAQMALKEGSSSGPVVINNNNVTNVAGGGGRGGAPGRSGGAPSTSPNMSHIDRALYGDLYGVGVP